MTDEQPSGHPSGHQPRPTPNKPPSPAEMGPFSATYPGEAELPDDVVCYGPDIGTEAEYRLLGDVSGKRVLDLGCGAGQAAIALARQGAHVISVAPSADSLHQARDRAEKHELKIEIHQSDLADLPFLRADSVDLVYSAYALATVPDLGRAFRQVHRVLRPRRFLVFSVPHPAFSLIDPASNDPMRVRRAYWDPAPRVWEYDRRSGADHPHTIEELFTDLSRAGFLVDTILEPAPATDRAPSAYDSEIMRWVPATLIMRARKQGT